jgi:hypothetical protein
VRWKTLTLCISGGLYVLNSLINSLMKGVQRWGHDEIEGKGKDIAKVAGYNERIVAGRGIPKYSTESAWCFYPLKHEYLGVRSDHRQQCPRYSQYALRRRTSIAVFVVWPFNQRSFPSWACKVPQMAKRKRQSCFSPMPSYHHYRKWTSDNGEHGRREAASPWQWI